MKLGNHRSYGYRDIGIFLAPQYALYALIPIIELLRVANQTAGKRLFNWTFISEDGGPVEAGAGMTLNCNASIHSGFAYDLVLVLSGNDAVSYLSGKLTAWLQGLNRHGALIAGVDTGAFALAEAGLLNGKRATCHWEAEPIFLERYPNIDFVERRYIIDPPIMTCAGGIAALDMMLEYLSREQGPILASQVANGFVYPSPFTGDGPQRLSPEAHKPSAKNDQKNAVLNTISLMEESIETPLSVQEIAEKVGISRRNLERQFKRATRSTIAQYYLRVRLERAREILFYSEMAVSEISIICGFSSPAVFVRTFKLHFGTTPGSFRLSHSATEMARFRSHVTWTLADSANHSG
ncbi:GlxA family transcriptional regulator [Ruegeria sp. EL01]|uniref:GlxA family transcriptional regulator n=1 Tax=Ruegeria sp. EL01 TaxID=2107578 RepID=UPI0013C49C08|nr:GlxA family transcriptional regulator [Ruegeria sp. EL01]